MVLLVTISIFLVLRNFQSVDNSGTLIIENDIIALKKTIRHAIMREQFVICKEKQEPKKQIQTFYCILQRNVYY